jgi:hypothetical protein
MINYIWNCKTVDVRPLEQGKTNVIYNVHWILKGSSNGFESAEIGSQPLILESEKPFIPIEDVTNEIATNWVISALGEDRVDELKEIIRLNIDKQENPTSITVKLSS